MFVLINEEEMQLIAKHPNFALLHELGIIMCPDDCVVMPFDINCLNAYNEPELEMLYISTTNKVREEYPQLGALRRLLVAYINEIPETKLDAPSTGSQADYCIQWGIEGYCSYLPGKREPSDTEGLWQYPTVDRNVEWENAHSHENCPILFKAPLAAAFKQWD